MRFLDRVRSSFVALWRDRPLLAVLLIALCVVVPRNAWIARAHSECIDDDYHLVRGVRFLRGELGRTPLNDPILGATVMSLPVYVAGAVPNSDPKYGLIVQGQRHLKPEVITMIVALWKGVLYVPFVGLCFAWIRRIYNAKAGWAAAVLLLIEPTISAHLVPAALDVLGFEMIVLASWCWWHYFERPTWGRLIVASVVSPAAMLTKHTAIVVPAVALGYAIVWWVGRPTDEPRGPWLRRQAIHIAAAVAIAVVALCVLAGPTAHLSTPRGATPETSIVARLAQYPLPAGLYWRSIQTAFDHGEAGHAAWLLGEPIVRGSWRNWLYYPVVALYKVPVELLVLIGLAVASLAIVRPRFQEWALAVPALLLFTLITVGGINIGFRHAIPAYGLLLMLATRVLLVRWRLVPAVVTGLLTLTVLDVARFGPDLLSYVNLPHRRVWLAISASNLDWGQGMKEVRAWVDSHPEVIAGKDVHLRLFGLPYSKNVDYYLGSRGDRVRRTSETPEHGLLILSPTYLVGSYEDEPERFAFLRDQDPIAVIGHSSLMFDLDAVRKMAAR